MPQRWCGTARSAPSKCRPSISPPSCWAAALRVLMLASFMHGLPVKDFHALVRNDFDAIVRHEGGACGLLKFARAPGRPRPGVEAEEFGNVVGRRDSDLEQERARLPVLV